MECCWCMSTAFLASLAVEKKDGKKLAPGGIRTSARIDTGWQTLSLTIAPSGQ